MKMGYNTAAALRQGLLHSMYLAQFFILTDLPCYLHHYTVFSDKVETLERIPDISSVEADINN